MASVIISSGVPKSLKSKGVVRIPPTVIISPDKIAKKYAQVTESLSFLASFIP